MVPKPTPENDIVPAKYEEPVEEERNGWVVALCILFVIALAVTILAANLWYTIRIELLGHLDELATGSGDSANSASPAGAAASAFAGAFVGALGLVFVIGIAVLNFIFTGVLYGISMRKTFTYHTWRKKFFIVTDVLFGVMNIMMILFLLLTFISF